MVIVWKSKGLSGESIKPRDASNNSFNLTSNNSFNPGVNYINNVKMRVKFNGSCF